MQTSQKVNITKGNPGSIDPATDVGAVTLNVADQQRMFAFYTGVVGLHALRQTDHEAVLGAGGRPIVNLVETPGARHPAANATGLYHTAILFPDRQSLAVKITQLASAKIPFGYADHLVSEAFYLSDVEGNGIELYRDRPRSEWAWDQGSVRMASDPIDFASFFAEVKDGDAALGHPAVPDRTKLGHVHLRVADIPAAEAFYHGVLGFDVTAKMPGALFLSAGGYHHHLGMNTWESRGGPPAEPPATGLREFSVLLPDAGALDRVVKRIETAGIPVEREGDAAIVLDPSQNRVRLQVGGKAG